MGTSDTVMMPREWARHAAGEPGVILGGIKRQPERSLPGAWKFGKDGARSKSNWDAQ
jgi:hypothetical protein